MNTDLERKFISFLKENQGIIHKVCKIYTDTSDDHKDLFQEITIQLWRSFPTFKGEAKFSTWMYRVALNTAITSFKKSKKHSVLYSDVDLSSLTIEYQKYHDDEYKLKKMYQVIQTLSEIEKL